jgi:hypothetical protein
MWLQNIYLNKQIWNNLISNIVLIYLILKTQFS